MAAPVTHETRGLRQRTVRALGWAALQTGGAALVSTVVVVVLARLLPPAAFGLMALATVWVNFATLFVDQGLSDALVQRREVDPEHLDTAFWASLAAGVALAGGSLASAGVLARLLGEPALAPVVQGLAPVFVLSALGGTQQALLRRELKFRALALRTTAATAAGGVAGVAAALMGAGVWALVAQAFVTALVGTAVVWRATPWRPRLRVSIRHLRDLLGFGGSLLGANLLNFVSRNADDLLIGAFLGPVALGYYSVAYRLVRQLGTLIKSVTNSVAFSAFSRLQDDPARMRRGFYTAALYTAVVSFPSFVALAVLAPALVAVLFGPGWGPSVPVMQILAFVGLLHTLFFFNTTVILSAGKPSWRLGLTALNAATDLLVFALVVRHGLVAVAAAFVARGYLFAPLPLLLVRRLIGIRIREYLRQLAPPAGATVLMAGAMAAVLAGLGSAPAALRLGAAGVLGGGVYLGAMYLLAPSLSGQLVRLAREAVTRRKAAPAPAEPAAVPVADPAGPAPAGPGADAEGKAVVDRQGRAGPEHGAGVEGEPASAQGSPAPALSGMAGERAGDAPGPAGPGAARANDRARQ